MGIVDAKKFDSELFFAFVIDYRGSSLENDEILFRYETLRKCQYEEFQLKGLAK